VQSRDFVPVVPGFRTSLEGRRQLLIIDWQVALRPSLVGLQSGFWELTVAILIARALPRWIGWLGLLVGVLAGLLGLLSPPSSVIAGISSIRFISFFVFMLSTGLPLLRRRSKAEESNPGSAQRLT
jgi:hypothetical protein